MLRRLARGALDLLVAVVADQQDVVVVESANRLASWCTLVTSGQVASMVFRLRSAACGVDRRGDAVGGEHDGRALGHLVELLDEDRAARLEVGHDVLVVHDLLAHVDGRAVEVQRLLDGDHGPVDAGAVAARRRQQDGRSSAMLAGMPRSVRHGTRV